MDPRRLKTKFRQLAIWPFVMAAVAAFATAGIYYKRDKAVVICLICFLVLLFIAIVFLTRLYVIQKDDVISGATRFGRVQREFLKNIEVPLAITDKDGSILWKNENFAESIGKDLKKGEALTELFPELYNYLSEDTPDRDIICEHGKNVYRISTRAVDFIKKQPRQEAQENDDEAENTEKLFAVTFFDETELSEYKKENRNLRPVVGIIYIDNYDEVTRTIDEMQETLMVALVDRRINRYFSKYDALVKKIETDKYFVVFKHQFIDEITRDRFSVLEDVKSVNPGVEVPVTLSIGLGDLGTSYSKNFSAARECLDTALGRGGDQAVLRTEGKDMYFGAGNRGGGGNTRVKARVKAQALREIMLANEDIIVMGHKTTDEDAFGAAIGIYCAARTIGKKAHIVIDSGNSTLRPIKELFDDKKEYDKSMFYTAQEALEKISAQTVLVIVDTAKPSITVSPELIEKAKTIVVFDHHRQGSERIESAALSYVEPYSSSASEMVAEVLQYFDDDIKLSRTEATAIYAGIVVDTNNFVKMTGTRTFEAAVYLKRHGADGDLIHKLLRNDLASYRARAEALRQTVMYRGVFAISAVKAGNTESPTIASAQAANEMLNITDVKAAFVLTLYNEKIYISARSIDEVNVQIIMEKLGGGGHLNTAGAQLSDMTLEEAHVLLINTIDEMIESGDISV